MALFAPIIGKQQIVLKVIQKKIEQFSAIEGNTILVERFAEEEYMIMQNRW